MKNIKILLEYLMGIFLIFSSIVIFVQEQKFMVGSIIILLGGLICLPISRNYIERQSGFKLSKFIKYVFVIFCWILLGVLDDRHENFKQEKQRDLLELNKNFVQQAGIIEKGQKENIKEIPQAKEISKNYLEVVNTANLPKQKALKEVNIKSEQIKSVYRRNRVSEKNKSKKNYKRGYIRGPRGGCYYINSNGNKAYVDRSFCD